MLRYIIMLRNGRMRILTRAYYKCASKKNKLINQ